MVRTDALGHAWGMENLRKDVSAGQESAPGRIRTCGLLLRRQTLYPLSYGGAG